MPITFVMATELKSNIIGVGYWKNQKPEGKNLLREVHPVYEYDRGLIQHFAGYALCWVDPETQTGAVCDDPWTQEEALEVLSCGGGVFSGHRNSPGIRANQWLKKALDTWSKDWYNQIDKVIGPSSWTVYISVKDGNVFADEIKIIPR